MAHGQKKKRKVLTKAQQALGNPVWAALRQDPLTVEKQAALVVAARTAHERIATGHPEPDDSQSLAQASNIALILCEWGHGAEWIEEVRKAQDALVASMKQHQDTGQLFALGPAENAYVENMLDVFQQQVALVGGTTVTRALGVSLQRLAQGNAVRAARGALK